jgi:DNA-binding response OmpR family regulator
MKNYKILIIDDSKVIRMYVKEMLIAGDFEFIEAEDGLEGYYLIGAKNPDLIILNLVLPKMSGWEVYEEIQKQQKFRKIPLLLISGRKEELTDKLPEPFEYFAFVEKPFDQQQLLDAMKQAMIKAKKHPQKMSDVNLTYFSESTALSKKIVNLETELEKLKKQLILNPFE